MSDAKNFSAPEIILISSYVFGACTFDTGSAFFSDYFFIYGGYSTRFFSQYLFVFGGLSRNLSYFFLVRQIFS